MNAKSEVRSCVDCSIGNCERQHSVFPKFCLTKITAPSLIAKSTEIYRGQGLEACMARSAAEIEGEYYCKLTRVEETVAFARRIGAAKIGIASCISLMGESKIFAKILKVNDLEPFVVACKVGSVDKSEIGVRDEFKIKKGTYEAICNPVLQAMLMNQEKTDLNVIVGLCVGHDSLFIKHSDAPVTVLLTKDRVLGHNPAAALYTSGSYYTRLLKKGESF